NMSRWYWDFTALKERIEIGQMPYTPVISHFFALKKSLEIIEEETLENIISRHDLNARAFRNSMQAIGLKLFVKDCSYRSNAVTAIVLPKDIEYKQLAKVLKNEHNVIIGGGLRHLSGKIFRVGHLGMLHSPEVITIANAIEMSLYKLGYEIELGTAASSASKAYLDK
ncbi:MAG: alanine--glyoxylate aminotransferase family protein, partial [Clostridia bacterium]